MKRKILRIIIYDKSLIIKALIMSLALHSSILTAQSEQNITEMYVVNDPDGYTNLRDESGMQSQIIQRLANKRIVYRDPDKEIENGWIPVSFVDNSEHIVHFSGYIHQSRLQQLDKNYVTKLQTYRKYYEDKVYIYPDEFFLMSFNTPDLFVMRGNCEICVLDLKRDEIILQADVPVCFDLILGDTLSLGRFYDNNYKRSLNNDPERLVYPMFAIYKFYQKPNGHYDYYTDIFPEPRKVSKEKAELLVKSIRNHQTDYPFFFSDLFLAFCSGVDAWEIFDGLSGDGEAGLVKKDWKFLKDAYDRSKMKP